MIVGYVILIPFILFVPETREDAILSRRARRLRKETGNGKLYARVELKTRTIKGVLVETVIRPVGKWSVTHLRCTVYARHLLITSRLSEPVMLVSEPIVFLFGLWDGLNYG